MDRNMTLQASALKEAASIDGIQYRHHHQYQLRVVGNSRLYMAGWLYTEEYLPTLIQCNLHFAGMRRRPKNTRSTMSRGAKWPLLKVPRRQI